MKGDSKAHSTLVSRYPYEAVRYAWSSPFVPNPGQCPRFERIIARGSTLANLPRGLNSLSKREINSTGYPGSFEGSNDSL